MKRYEMTAHSRALDAWYSMDPDTLGDYVTYEDAIAAIEAAYREGFAKGVIVLEETGRAFGSDYDDAWANSEAKRKAESSDE